MFNRKLKEENKSLKEQVEVLTQLNEERNHLLEEVFRMMDYTFKKLDVMKIGKTKSLKYFRDLKTNLEVAIKTLGNKESSL